MEKKISFIDLTQEECYKYYPLLIENSDTHFEIASLLSGRQLFGPAISHLILGAEELVKGLILALDSVGLNIRSIEGVELFFLRHNARHHLFFILEIITRSREPIMELLTKMHSYKSGFAGPENENDLALYMHAIWGIEGDSYKAALDEIAAPHSEGIMRSAVFWKIADYLKMRGFYVDYKDGLRVPKELTKENYDFAVDVVSSTKTIIMKQINQIKSLTESNKEQFIKLHSSEEGLYGLFKRHIPTKEDMQKII